MHSETAFLNRSRFWTPISARTGRLVLHDAEGRFRHAVVDELSFLGADWAIPLPSKDLVRTH